MNSSSQQSTSVVIPTTALSRALDGVRGLAAAAGSAALDIASAVRALRSEQRARERAASPIVAALTVHSPPAEVYAWYRDFAQLPTFMEHMVSVREVDPTWSHWVAALPSGSVAWDVKIVDDLPGELIAWRSVKGSVIDLRARIVFSEALGGEATDLRVELRVGATRTRRGRALARLFTATEVAADLRRLKHLVEATPKLRIAEPVAPQVPVPDSERWHPARQQSRLAH